jgi:hypothetical protein
VSGRADLARLRGEFDAGRSLADVLAARRRAVRAADAQIVACARGHRVTAARAAVITGHRPGALRLARLSLRLLVGG